MTPIVETGKLPIGVEYDGQRYRDFTLRPMRVKDSLAARRSKDFERCDGDDEMMGLLSFSHRLEVEGIQHEAMTIDLMLDLYEDDLEAIIAADGRLREEIARFRGQGEADVDAGASADRDAVGDGRKDGPCGGDGVDRGLERIEPPGREAAKDLQNQAQG